MLRPTASVTTSAYPPFSRPLFVSAGDLSHIGEGSRRILSGSGPRSIRGGGGAAKPVPVAAAPVRRAADPGPVSFSGGGYGAGAEEEEDKPRLFSRFKKSLRLIPTSKPVKKLGRLCWHVPHDGFAGRQWRLGYHRAHRPGELSGCPMVLAGCLP